MATYARCDGIFVNHFTADLLENQPVKFCTFFVNFENLLRLDRVDTMSIVSPFFMENGVY